LRHPVIADYDEHHHQHNAQRDGAQGNGVELKPLSGTSHRDLTIRNGIDELSTLANDALGFVLAADDEARDILEEEDRHGLAVAQLNEVSALTGRVREKDAIISQDAYGIAIDFGPACDERTTPERFEFQEAGIVHDASYQLPNVKRLAGIGGDDLEDFFGGVSRRGSCAR
jgi:hypothetical protein